MKITSKDIEDSKQNRDKFNKYYNDAVIDVITLKKECKMSIEQYKQQHHMILILSYMYLKII
jgi:hypothetical protein